MKSKMMQFGFLLGGCVALLILSTCGGDSRTREFSMSPKQGRNLIRLMDKLGEEHVESSPLKTLNQGFHSREEEPGEAWTLLKDLSHGEHRVWGYATGSKMLFSRRSRESRTAGLYRNGTPVNYSEDLYADIPQWSVLTADETVKLQNDSRYNRTLLGIPMSPGDVFSVERILPGGNLAFMMRIVNKNWKDFISTFAIYLDGEKIEDIHVYNNWVSIARTRIQTGSHKVELKYVKAKGSASSNSSRQVILGMFRIISSSDLVLYSEKSDSGVLEGNFVLRYLSSEAPLSGVEIPAFQNRLYLFNLQDRFLMQDYQSGENPWGIKKKMTLNAESLNGMLAPPDTRISIPLKVFSGARLDFQYGVMNEYDQAGSDRVFRFSVKIRDGENETLLLDDSMSWNENPTFISRKEDLSTYAGREVQLVFETTEPPENQGKNLMPPVVPVWINPVVYREKHGAPNVILISLDTLRPDHLGVYGYKRNTSPAIDALAEDGVVFRNVFSTTSWTLPGHVSMLTALEGHRHGIYYPYQKMNGSLYTFADMMRVNDYYCAAFTGGGYLSEKYGFAKGFDRYYRIKLHGDQSIRLDESEMLYGAAKQWLNENSDKPFFLFLHTYQTHDPYANSSHLGKKFLAEGHTWEQVALGEEFGESDRFHVRFTPEEQKNIVDLYDGEILYTDQSLIAPLVKQLKDLGIYENTLIIITSDHGDEFYEHEAWLHDHSLYNEGTRIPLVMKFPRSFHRQKNPEPFVRITDILPTVMDYLDIDVSFDYFDGASLLPVIRGEETEHRQFISDLALRKFHSPPDIIAISHGQYKLIINRRIVSPYARKTAFALDESRIELYDLAADPGEQVNLARSRAHRKMCLELIEKVNRLYPPDQAAQNDGETVKVDEKLRKRLESLGYL